MLTYKFKKNEHLNREIERLESQLCFIEPGTDEYTTTLKQIEELKRLKRPPFNPETLIPVIGNILVAVLIVKHEEINVITSKAGSFLLKPRV